MKIQNVGLALGAFLLCANFSMDQSGGEVTGGGVKPIVNFKGQITDNTEKTFQVENISISGLYKQIPVYAVPSNLKDSEYNPTVNTIRLDLAEIKKITVLNPETLLTFKNRTYIVIDVYSNNAPDTKNSYLMENSKKVLCAEVNPAGPIERELQFSAIREIVIDSYEKPEPKEADKKPAKGFATPQVKTPELPKTPPAEPVKTPTSTAIPAPSSPTTVTPPTTQNTPTPTPSPVQISSCTSCSK